MSTNTGLNTLGFIQANSLTYTEIMRDYDAFIGALSEDEKLGFKTLFEGTNSQILTEMISAKESDELYHIITSRSENLMYYLNRWDSATAISQNYSYSTYRGSNIKLQITLTPDQTIVLPKFSTVATSGDMDLIITKDVELTQGVSTTFVAYVGTVKEQELVADTEDLLVFRFTNSNISEQIALFLNGSEVPWSRNILDMTDDKYFCITNAYGGIDCIYLNKRTDFTHRYTNNSVLKLKYIEYQEITLNSLEVQSLYGDITNIVQLASTIKPETVTSIKINGPLYAETQNRIVARDDFHKVLKGFNPEIVDATGQDYSNAIVECTYVKENGELMTETEYQEAYDYLYKRRSFGIPMCLLEHPDVMLGLNLQIILQLSQGSSAVVARYVRQVLAKHEFKLGYIIDFSAIEHELESYDFVKTARVLPFVQEYQAGALVAEGTVFKPSTPNGKLYIVRNPLFLTGSEQPEWPTNIGDTVNDNDIIWQVETKSYAPQPYWEANKSIRKENIVWVEEKDNIQFKCIGYTYKTGSTEPEWPTEEGKYITDNQILWVAVSKNLTAPVWTKDTITEKGHVVNSTEDSELSYQAINYIPKTSAEEPEWKTDESIFTDGAVQYAVINELYDTANSSASLIHLNWNQYCKFNESIQVV